MRLLLLIVVAALAGGCAGPGGGSRSAPGQDVSAAREVRVGMTSGEVAGVLGLPSTLSVDANRNEIWIYDDVPAAQVHSDVEDGELSLRGVRMAASASSGTRTLSVVTKFDADLRVRDFSSHISRR